MGRRKSSNCSTRNHDLSDLLQRQNIDPREVIVFRHCPREPELNKVIGWLAEQEPDLFNVYQQTQGERVEKGLLSARYVASLRHGRGYACLWVYIESPHTNE